MMSAMLSMSVCWSMLVCCN